MKPFTSKYLATPALLLTLCLSIPPVVSCGADQDEISQIESQLTQERQKFEAFHTKERNLLTELSDLEREVAKRKAALEELKKKLVLDGREREDLRKEMSRLEREAAHAETQLAARLAALYKRARRGYVKFLASAEDLDQLRKRIRYARAVLEDDRRALGDLVEKKMECDRQAARMELQMKRLQAREEEEKAQLEQLGKQLEEKVILLMNVHREKEFYETAVKELRLAAKELKRTLVKIENKRSDGEKWAEPGRFAKCEGKLPLPVEGRIVNDGQFLGTSDLNLRKGIFIESASPREVKAVFKGRVDFSGRLKGYGDVLVINHGSRFFTISALLSRRIKEEGDLVEAGEAIGWIGGKGGISKEPRLYFEIRKGGESLDPLRWLRN